MTEYYLAIDIGASSGRHMLGYMKNGRIAMDEIYRFTNGLSNVDGEACWNITQLFEEIKNGLKQCKSIGKIPKSMGIDTWGVDFVLLDHQDHVVGNAVGYRDKRTDGMDQVVYHMISEAALYRRTGIQKQIFNTIYQLMALKEKKPDLLHQAETLLLIPDYFHFLLTGEKATEYTNSTTTQLVNPLTKNWDWDLIDLLGFSKKLFKPIKNPGTLLGRFTKEIVNEIGFDCAVILPATHDTASAVLAVPSNEEKTLYISSGTWSLMGVERMEADCTEMSRALNFTNEGGYEYRFRYLKNIMGLWMIQSLKKELNDEYSFAQLCELSEQETIESVVDCNNGSFLAPASMIRAIEAYCANSNQQVPTGAAQFARVIYQSLAKCYGDVLNEIQSMTGETYPIIYVVGGGANAAYLNALTASATEKKVIAGPTEATAIGNLIVQMLYDKKWSDVMSARNCIRNSFEMKEYDANQMNHWR